LLLPTDSLCLMLEQDSQEHATKRPANATWQSSFVACMVVVIVFSPRHFTGSFIDCMKASRCIGLFFRLINLRKMAVVRGLVMTGKSQAEPASPHKHTRECCRVALSSAAVPKPRGKAFKRARFETLIHMTRKKRFAIVDYEAASSMQLCSTCSTRRLDRDMGLP
jgi:hypothetical protein